MVLTRFKIYKNTAFPQLAPSLWKCFGSTDGVEWFELFQAHNFVRLTETCLKAHIISVIMKKH